MKRLALAGGFVLLAASLALAAQAVRGERRSVSTSAANPAPGQSTSVVPTDPASDLATERQALDDARRRARIASQRSADLDRQAGAARDEAQRVRAEASAIAARIQAAEADIAAAEARIRLIGRLQQVQRARLAERQGPIVRLTAALQTLARRPPALALAQPGSVTDLVHVRSLLGTMLPEVQRRTRGLQAAVGEGRRLGAEAEAVAAGLRGDRARLQVERQALARLEARERLRAKALAHGAVLESDRAIALGERARDIVDLMRQVSDDAAVGRALAALPGPLPRPADPAGARRLPEAVGLPAAAGVPDVGQVGDRLPYRLPVIGRLVTGLGELSDAGVRARGLTFATAADAQVVAPGAGRVLYAAPYRSFGRIVIIDHGHGWISLLTGMASLTTAVGDAVDRGSPLGRAGAGRAGSGRAGITVELRRHGRPVDMTSLVE